MDNEHNEREDWAQDLRACIDQMINPPVHYPIQRDYHVTPSTRLERLEYKLAGWWARRKMARRERKAGGVSA